MELKQYLTQSTTQYLTIHTVRHTGGYTHTRFIILNFVVACSFFALN